VPVLPCLFIGTLSGSDGNRVLFGGWPARGTLVAHALVLALYLPLARRNQYQVRCFPGVKTSTFRSGCPLAGYAENRKALIDDVPKQVLLSWQLPIVDTADFSIYTVGKVGNSARQIYPVDTLPLRTAIQQHSEPGRYAHSNH